MAKSDLIWVNEKRPKFSLADVATTPPKGFDKQTSLDQIPALGARMEELFDLLFFASQHSLLIIFQGMDTAGKDGAIRHILQYSHAQSCKVVGFKVPTSEELAHDFLWRCHKQTPGKGEITIFNRSHYEDVGVVRVHEIVPEKVWRARYAHINNWEELLIDSNTIVLKIFLHISSKEQEERLLEREQDPKAAWKLNAGDWQEREFWNDYQVAYSEAIGRCASEKAPWLVVPADKKWYRNLIVTQAIIKALEPYESGWREKLEAIGAEAKAELKAYRSQK